MSTPRFIAIEAGARAPLAPLFGEEQPGPLAAAHAIETGIGFCVVDRLEDPSFVAAGTGHDVQLVGDPNVFHPRALAQAADPRFIACRRDFLPALEAAFPRLVVWDRVIFRIDEEPPTFDVPAVIRRLRPDDATALAELEPDLAWICATHGGPQGTAVAGVGFGAFVDHQLASVCVPFHRGQRFEDLGVVTQDAFRGLGLSPATAAATVSDVHARGKRVSWSTTPDNRASIRVARKLGAEKVRDDVLYVTGNPDDA